MSEGYLSDMMKQWDEWIDSSIKSQNPEIRDIRIVENHEVRDIGKLKKENKK